MEDIVVQVERKACGIVSRCYVDQQYGPTLSSWNRRRLTWRGEVRLPLSNLA